MDPKPIKIGLIAELTGPLSFMGVANANLTTMLVDDINARGGLLGRPLELVIEDGETIDNVAKARTAKLIDVDMVDVVVGGIYSSTRQAIKSEAVTRGKTLYIYTEQYEGQENHPLIFCTGPVPAQQVEPLIPWLMNSTGAKKFYLPSSDYIWPHVLNKAASRVVRANGGEIVGEEYLPLDTIDFRRTAQQIMASGTDVVFNTIVPPGLTPFFEELHEAGFGKRGGKIVCTYFDENFFNLVPSEQIEGLYSCLDYYQELDDPFGRALLRRYQDRYPGSAMLTAGSGCTGHYRAIRMWEAAVKEAGTVERDAVIRALDHARISEGPGGPAEMVPGQHHVCMNMYIAQAQSGRFRVVKSLGPIDPNERLLGDEFRLSDAG
ncbi:MULTISPECIES: substrate-binding protein [Mesorhizobium]|jgi:ABC-type branched-subunit amino acid transport system substrate-binding protein|uniref:Amino acid/amide ABC transporter substrate-binding protein (HAAT family) n=1 Tax=Rhizobium loti TaxID=381 RepID=A0A8E2WBL9_RHILI|nr:MULTISPECIES: substrate-binding protein [Mesorhizobium]PWJ90402.1 amino acid/amide ABC transporter substrate-binding protein (HAAT family) [Mesorhizobium loti]RUX93313.1 ABC transporter substrate-binding protein [Mesorhizobium sp. M7D.F.Ca.US.004.01.2.1]RVA32566.1 ABC transporter substrate-binding protein [Mesorhizobium sp. M7D.F.Ca.US.004.03.1.1]